MMPEEMDEFSGYRYELMRPQQIIAAREKSSMAFIPLGPMEWHAPHMPYGTDMLHAYAISLHLAKQFGGVVLPPLPLGSETILSPDRLRDRGFKGDEKIIGMDFPDLALPSLYIEESAFASIVLELVRALKRQGFRVVVIVNGHGGKYHLIALDRIAAEESERGQVAVIHGFPVDPERRRLGGHAEKFESSFMKAYYPETVDLAALPPLGKPIKNMEFGILDGPTCIGEPTPDYTVRENQDPRHANEKDGQEELKNAVHLIGTRIREAMRDLKLQQTAARK